ncbi:glycosyltransferase [Microvirga sp. BT689]|uniref:glycosyltransferase n=1 Tax=Microvirga arvi TaxID=2778731 RepID=UPI00194E19AE|nr:glycosyltransferase [Microvirga arvi]MBM6583908.1 glycosyltransferase [Microvirga arvi]
MQNDLDEVIAENIALRLLIACPSPEDGTARGAADLEEALHGERERVRQALADGGLPAAFALCSKRVECSTDFPVAAYKAFLANTAWQGAESDAPPDAIAHLIADTILARVFVRSRAPSDPSTGSERITKFTAFLRQTKLDLVARVQAAMSGDGEKDPLALYRDEFAPRRAVYAGALLRTHPPSAPSAALRHHWSRLITGGGLEARRVRRYEFGGPARHLKTPLVFTDGMHERAEIALRFQAAETTNASPARAFVAVGAKDEHGRFIPVTWALQGADGHFLEEGPLLCGEIVAQPTWTGCVHLTASAPGVEVICCVVPLSPGESLTVWSQFREQDASWGDTVPLELRDWVAAHLGLAQQAMRHAADLRQQSDVPTGGRRLAWPRPSGSPVTSIPLGEDADQRTTLITEATDFILQDNLEGAIHHLIAQSSAPDPLSHMLQDLADAVADARPNDALRLYWLSYGVCASARRRLRLSGKMFLAGNISSADALSRDKSPATTHLHGELRLTAALRRTGPMVPRRAHHRQAASKTRVAYVASAAQPFQVTGYTVRTHQLLSALNTAGTLATCFIRPGYPHDRARTIQAWPDGSREAQDFAYMVEGVPYQTSWVPGVDHDPEHFIQRMADRLVAQFETYQPTIVQAASNYRNALPALRAARRLGIPFIYEVRGLWELTAASRKSGWEATERFRFERDMERSVAAEADMVLTITRALAAELVSGGVPESRIGLLPNAVDPDHFTPTPRDEALAAALGLQHSFTLVYAGSLTVYEGLDDLIEAIRILRQDSVPVSLVVIGDGVVRPALEQLVQDKGLQAFVQFLGRVRPDEILAYLSLAHAVALPRKAYRVCKIVSPLKPFEAMAMAKPVILTDLPVLREIVRDGYTGLICQPEDPHDLARALRRLVDNPGLCRALGDAARRWVIEERSWSANAALLQDLHGQLVERAAG